MDQNNQNKSDVSSQDSATFGNVLKDPESIRTLPKDSENFGTNRNDPENFRSVPKHSEHTENHTLTVREAARLFEAAGVARTERSIVNWCQPNRQGICRLDCYFDPNERKYYITRQSIETVIAEEKVRADKINELSENVGAVQNDSEVVGNRRKTDSETNDHLKQELERQNLDLKITNRAKDMVIEHLQNERGEFLNQLLTASRKVGELETRLLKLDGTVVRVPIDKQDSSST